MITGLTEEHEELREITRRFLAEKSSLTQVRKLAESGANRDDAVWHQMADQLMLQGIAIPEEYGGAGYGPVELGIVLEELGRALTVAPYLSTVALAGQTLTTCSDNEARSAWLPGIAEGAVIATLAVADETGEIDPAGVTSVATSAGEDWKITGTKRFVIDGVGADMIIVAARAGEELALFTVKGDAEGVRREPLAQLDPTRQVATVNLDNALAVRIEDDATAVLARVADLVAVALAAEQTGGAAATLDMAVEYTKIRVQFGRPIGSFQAIKHRCADLLTEVESARNAAFSAASLLTQDDPEGPVAAALAAAWCATTYTHAAKENIQLHGGIGFTWEHDAHFHLKRAKTSELLLGTPARHRARVADLAGI